MMQVSAGIVIRLNVIFKLMRFLFKIKNSIPFTSRQYSFTPGFLDEEGIHEAL